MTNLEVVKTRMIASPALRQDFKGVCSLFSDCIKKCEVMNHPDHNISEVSVGSGRGGREVCGRGRGVRGGKGGSCVDKGLPPTYKEISTCTHMSDQYFSDNNYKYLSPAEKFRLCHICKKITGKDSNPSPPPYIINQVKSNISELKVTLRDMEMGVDSNDKDNLFSDNDDNI